MAADVVAVDCQETVLNKFAQGLAANEKKIRDRWIKKLKLWLEARSHIEKGRVVEEDHLKIWKGLHYCMWMSDKPLVQEDLAETIANLVLCFSKIDAAFIFIDTFFKTEAREWFNIDRLRLDKFMMLVRKCLNRGMLLVKQHGWRICHIRQFAKILAGTVLSGTNENVPDGLKFHVLDIYLDELVNVADKELDKTQSIEFLEPCCTMLAFARSTTTFRQLMDRVFRRVIDEARQSNDAMQVDDNMDTTRLQFDLDTVQKRLFQLASKKSCVSHNRAAIYDLVKRLQSVHSGTACSASRKPTIKLPAPLSDADIDKAAAGLQAFEEKIHESSMTALKKAARGKKRQADDSMTGKTKRKKKKKMDVKENCDEFTKLPTDSDENCFTKLTAKSEKKDDMNDEVNENAMDIGDENSAMDIGDENNPLTKKNKEKRKKKKKGGQTDSLVASKTNSISDDTSTKDNSIEEVSGKKKKRKRKKRKQAMLQQQNGDQNGSSAQDSNQQSGKTKANKCSPKSPSNKLMNNGNANVTILKKQRSSATKQHLPTQKQSASVKDIAESNMSLVNGNGASSSDSSTSQKKKKETFANFVNSPTVPAAFVRKAMAKVTPKTEPKKVSQKIKEDKAALSNPSGKKRVIFAMNKNTSQEFCNRFNSSPNIVAFSPSQTPIQGILKSPMPATPKTKLFKSRAKASDFF